MNIKRFVILLSIIAVVVPAISLLQTTSVAAAPTCSGSQVYHSLDGLCWEESEPTENARGDKTVCAAGKGEYSGTNKKCNKYAGVPDGANADLVQCDEGYTFHPSNGKCYKYQYKKVTGQTEEECNGQAARHWNDGSCWELEYDQDRRDADDCPTEDPNTHYGNGTCNRPKNEDERDPKGYGNECRNNETGATERVERECNADETNENTTPNSGDENGGEEVTCAVDGVGWLVCPVANFLALITDGAYGIIDGMLDYNMTTDPQARDDLKKQWSVFANIANVAFIIVFLIVIASHVSGIGISNYSLKRMLPRIIVGAILVNASFYICLIAIDISNILGNNLKEALTESMFAGGVQNGTWEEVISSILAGGTAIAGGVVLIATGAALAGGIFAFLGLALPVLITALTAIITVFMVLIARQALITILIVIAPLAFVANLLPNTEQWYKRWQKTFIGVLIVFPAVAILFGGAQLAAGILTQSNAGVSMKVFALGVQAAPLFLVLGILKKLMNMDSIANGTQRLGGKLGGALGKKGQEAANRRQAKFNANHMVPSDHKRWDPRRYAGSAARRAKQHELEDSLTSQRATRAFNSRNADRMLNEEGYADKMAGGDARMANLLTAQAIQQQQKEIDEGMAARAAVHDTESAAQIAQHIAGVNEHGDIIDEEKFTQAVKQNGEEVAAALKALSDKDFSGRFSKLADKAAAVAPGSTVVNKTVASAMSSAGMVGAGAADAISRGDRSEYGSIEQAVVANGVSGGFTGEKFANMSGDHAKYLENTINNAVSSGLNGSTSARDKIKSTASDTLVDERLMNRLGKQKDTLGKMARW